MELSNNVRIANGRVNVLLRSAKFDFKSGAFRSDEPVEVRVSDGTTIVADRAFALNHGQELTFDGHVKTRIVPQTGPAAGGGCKGDQSMTLPPSLSGRRRRWPSRCLCASGADAASAPGAEKPASPSDSAAIFPGTNSKEPISIDADKLVYFDKEQKAIYSGNVVVIQGDTKMTCSAMTVFLDHAPNAREPTHAPAQGATGPNNATANPARRPTRASSASRRRGRSPSSPRPRSRPATTAAYDKAEEQGVADRPRHAQRRPERHQGRQADLRSQDRPGDGRHQRQVEPRPRAVRSQIEPDATKPAATRAKSGGDAAKAK